MSKINLEDLGRRGMEARILFDRPAQQNIKLSDNEVFLEVGACSSISQSLRTGEDGCRVGDFGGDSCSVSSQDW